MSDFCPNWVDTPRRSGIFRHNIWTQTDIWDMANPITRLTERKTICEAAAMATYLPRGASEPLPLPSIMSADDLADFLRIPATSDKARDKTLALWRKRAGLTGFRVGNHTCYSREAVIAAVWRLEAMEAGFAPTAHASAEDRGDRTATRPNARSSRSRSRLRPGC